MPAPGASEASLARAKSPDGRAPAKSAQMATSDATGGNQQAGHAFQGKYFLIPPHGNELQTIKILYQRQHLLESVYPAFKETFQAHGFDEVPWDNLLKVLTVGGEIVLKGKKFINRQAYAPHTMQKVFMRHERALASELMTIVFNKADTVSYMRELAPFEEVGTALEFDFANALRKTTMLCHAVNTPREDSIQDTYRIIIEGEGKGANLFVHRFQFQPSRVWHCRRYPENVD
jgi:hypothetical protein